MADYTAITEAGTALVELLRTRLTPEPLNSPEVISLCSPHESGNNQLTLYLYHIEEDSPNVTAGYYMADRDTMRRHPARFLLRYLVTAHSKAPDQMKEADQHRIIGAVLQTIRDNPVIPASCLGGSLAEEGAELHIMVEKTPLEQMLKIWNNTSKEYKLSLVVMVTGVTISSGVEHHVPRVTEVTIETDQKPGMGAQQ